MTDACAIIYADEANARTNRGCSRFDGAQNKPAPFASEWALTERQTTGAKRPLPNRRNHLMAPLSTDQTLVGHTGDALPDFKKPSSRNQEARRLPIPGFAVHAATARGIRTNCGSSAQPLACPGSLAAVWANTVRPRNAADRTGIRPRGGVRWLSDAKCLVGVTASGQDVKRKNSRTRTI